MMIKREKINYLVQNKEFEGIAIFNDGAKKAPAILVIHAWRGRDNFAETKAEELTKLGYVGFAIDLYGKGVLAKDDDEAFKLMSPLFIDREQLRARLVAALETIHNHPAVDNTQMGAIGFCFGGLSALEFAKSGADLKGVVSFHGLLGLTVGPLKAKAVANAQKIRSKMLVLHGHDDPSVSAEDISIFQKEMTEAKVDWQMNVYSHTSHAFTNPEASGPGKQYNPVVAKRAWQSMKNFFEEIFSGETK